MILHDAHSKQSMENYNCMSVIIWCFPHYHRIGIGIQVCAS